MSNTWVHSIVLGAVATALLVLATLLRVDDPQSPWSAPLESLSLLGPGLLIGWFTRRHPLLVGAGAALPAPWLANGLALERRWRDRSSVLASTPPWWLRSRRSRGARCGGDWSARARQPHRPRGENARRWRLTAMAGGG